MSVAAYTGFSEETEIRRLRTLYQLLTAITGAKKLEDIYEASITSLLAGTLANRAAILTFDEDGVMRFRAWRDLSAEYRQAATGYTPWRPGVQDAQVVMSPDVRLDESLDGFQESFAREGIRSLAFIPLSSDAGVFGMLALYYAQTHECGGSDLPVAQAIASHVALALEHKRAELALAQSEQISQAIVDNSATVVFIKDTQGRYVLVNRRFEELFQVTKAGIVGKTDYDVFPGETADRLRENDRNVLATGEPLTVEEYVPHNGVMHTYISNKFPIKDPDGRVSGVCGIATDITERKQLQAASLHLASIIEGSEDAIVGKDLSGIITSWNKGAERIFGYTTAEAVGHPVSMLAAPDRLDEMPLILKKIQQGQRIEHFETRRRRQDGKIIDVSLTVSPIRNAAGQVIGASKIARDITERKWAEKELARLLSREREAWETAELLNRIGPMLAAERDFEKLVRVVLDVVVVLVGAESGWFFHIEDEKSESYVLYKVSGARHETLQDIRISQSPGFFAPVLRAQGVIRSDDVSQDPEYVANAPGDGTPDGDLPVRSYLATPVLSRSGELFGGLIAGHSAPARFTEHQEALLTGVAAQAATALDNARLFEQAQWAQDELQRSNEELRRANQDLETFAYSASHDLKEPLRTIALSAQWIERTCGDRLQSDAATFLTSILQGASRMENLIQDLLAYTTATKNPEGPPPGVDSGSVLASVLENLHGPIEEAGATVTWDHLPVVCLHEGRLTQLFQNLISNALKYRSEQAPRIHVSAQERDGWNVFSVSDNGIGVDPQYGEQIFGLFKRLHSRDRYPGSGIGLAICQRIVQQYGGRIWLENSVPGQGSTFSFAIPAGTR